MDPTTDAAFLHNANLYNVQVGNQVAANTTFEQSIRETPKLNGVEFSLPIMHFAINAILSKITAW